MGKRTSIDHHKWWQSIKDHKYIRFSLFIIIGLITYGIMVTNIIPETLEVQPGSVSDRDIRSPITIENKPETDQLKQEAYESIEPIFTMQTLYAENQVARINEIFQVVRQTKRLVKEREEEISQLKALMEEQQQLEDEDENENNNDDEVIIELPEEISLDEQVLMVEEGITGQTAEDVTRETMETLLLASEEDLQMAKDTITSAVMEVMSKQISPDDLEDAKGDVQQKVILSSVDPSLYRSMIELAKINITPNYIYDEEATDEARVEAMELIDPVIVREGQLLVEEGQIITSEIYNRLRLVGLLDDHSNTYPYFGLGILVFLLVGMLAYYLGDAKTSLQHNNTHLLMFTIIYALTLLIMKLVSLTYLTEINGITYIVPVAMGTMLITILLHSRVALFTSMIFAICASIIFNDQSSSVIDYSHGIYVFFSSVAGVFFLSKSNKIIRILQSGIFVGALNVFVIASFLLLKGAQYSWMEIGLNLGFAALSGFVAAVLTLGLLPFLEAGFGVLSTTKLIELSNPNHPLLRKILLEAPGTYHHSVIVANLAEGACEAVGANGLLARVGAYYHDLGKTKRPHFFIENQMKIDNPHDKISPQLSKTIIIAHPYDGGEMLREYRMPKEIIGIAEQHHGTTLLKYFYHKANQESEKPISEEEFRYPGPRAQTKEAAIVGIADCVEAAVRSMNKPTPSKIETLVKKIINDRLEDGQFDECDITLRELSVIATSMCETLQGTFHTRIEYPEEVTDKEKEKQKEVNSKNNNPQLENTKRIEKDNTDDKKEGKED